MEISRLSNFVIVIAVLLISATALSDEVGSIRGTIYDKDFEVPLSAAKVKITETGKEAETNEDGNFIINDVKPGTYTLVFSKEGYVRHVKSEVVVVAGQMAEEEIWLEGEFTEMEEFVVQDVQIGTGTEAALLDLRMEAPALMDSISSDLMSQAGTSDAASALKLVAGATVQDGKYAVVRGLPDRYVNSQMNGVRLPTADPDKRAVQLDQFPSQVIESIQVTKTFTPDQQGDASGGAVNVVLKGIPEETFLKLNYGMSWNTNVENGEFLSHESGGVPTWASKTIEPQSKEGASLENEWDGNLGIMPADSKQDYKWSISGGGKFDLNEDIRIGGFGSFFYERDSSFYDDGIEDKYWIDPKTMKYSNILGFEPGMVPGYTEGEPGEKIEKSNGFLTSLYDTTQASRSVQWGGLGILGIETEDHYFDVLHMYTRDATDKVTRAIDYRGKTTYQNYWPIFYPGGRSYDIYDEPPTDPDERMIPQLHRAETIEYTERTTGTTQFGGRHRFDIPEIGIDKFLMFRELDFDWKIATSSATLYQPDKTLITSVWSEIHKFHTFGVSEEGSYPDINRIWKNIEEDSDQYFLNVKFPFEQWSGDEGYVKLGVFDDKTTRSYEQDSFYLQQPVNIPGGFEEPFNDNLNEMALMNHSETDVDYIGNQNLSAYYYMVDIPLNSYFNVIGGTRYETTQLSIENTPEEDATYINMSGTQVEFSKENTDVDFEEKSILPSLGFEFKPWEQIVLKGSYAETIARQTFKELSPVYQQEYVGDDVFSGNPELKMSSLDNYDLRLDYTPYEGGLISCSYFKKNVDKPIEYVQVDTDVLDFIRPFNFPEGTISGYEFEIRQKLDYLWEDLTGLTVGANATLIDSEVILPDDLASRLQEAGYPEPKRSMMNTPEHLYNLFFTYNLPETGTKFGLFYTVRGDTLIAGANAKAGIADSFYIPSVYETEYGTLNFSLSQMLFGWKLSFKAKNLLDPEIESVYRSDFFADDVTKTSYRKGIEYSIGLSRTF